MNNNKLVKPAIRNRSQSKTLVMAFKGYFHALTTNIIIMKQVLKQFHLRIIQKVTI